MDLNNSTLIVAAVLAGFVLYLAAMGRLAEYVALLTGQGKSATATSDSAAPGSSTSAGTLPGLPGSQIIQDALNRWFPSGEIKLF